MTQNGVKSPRGTIRVGNDHPLRCPPLFGRGTPPRRPRKSRSSKKKKKSPLQIRPRRSYMAASESEDETFGGRRGRFYLCRDKMRKKNSCSYKSDRRSVATARRLRASNISEASARVPKSRTKKNPLEDSQIGYIGTPALNVLSNDYSSSGRIPYPRNEIAQLVASLLEAMLEYDL